MSAPSGRSSMDTLDSRNVSPFAPYPSHGYPFPRQDTAPRGTSIGGSQRHGRNDSTASAASGTANTSVGGALDIKHKRSGSTSKEVSQNAIAILVHGKPTRKAVTDHAISQRAPTTRDIPPVTLTKIPHVESSEFDEYCQNIGPLLERFKQNRRELAASTATAGDANSSKRTDSVDSNATTRPLESPLSSHFALRSPAALSPPVSAGLPPNNRRRSSAQVRRKANEIPPLSTIPGVYFEDDFHLENPRTFDVVSEHAEIVKPNTESGRGTSNGDALPPRRSLATNAILQEKLSYYLDTVEVHLVGSISTASASFFAALGSLKALQQEAAESVRKIQSLRADLAALDENMVQGGREVAHMRRKRGNVRKLAQATQQLELVVQKAIKCEDLVENGEYDTASDMLGDLERLVAGESKPAEGTQATGHDTSTAYIDLRGLKAIRGLADGMINLHLRIGKGYETRFMEALLSDLRQHVDRVPAGDTIRRWSASFQRARGGHDRAATGVPAYLETEPGLRGDLLATLHGLHRAGHIASAATGFQSAIMKEMKTLIRKHLPSSNNDDAISTSSVSTRAGGSSTQQERSATLARNLRALDDGDAEQLLIAVYTDVSEAARRLGVQIKILIDVTSTFTAMNAEPGASSRPSSPGTAHASPVTPQSAVTPSIESRMDTIKTPVVPRIRAQDDLSQVLDMSSLLGQAVDVVQTQISRVLKVRAEQTHALPFERFVRYYTLNRLLADECEAISGRSGQVLKDIVNTQVNAYVQAFGDSATQDIVEKLSSDTWEAKDFTEAPKAILERILKGMEHDVPAWSRDVRLWEAPVEDTTYNAMIQNGEAATQSTVGPKTTQPANIDDRRYVLIKGAIAIIPVIDRFLAIASSMPTTITITISSLCEVLRAYDSRIKQLILGAGATRVAGLKNITTKHLALASQALGFVVALVPYVREGLRRQMAGKYDALGDLDKVKRLFQDHQMGIHEKLVDIMTARASAHIRTMQKINFDEATDTTDNGASPYIETLCRETTTLYRVLSKNLSDTDVVEIMYRIFASYKDLWTKAFAESEVKTAAGKDRLLKDAEVFSTKLGNIEGFGDIGKTVLEQVRQRQIEPPKVVTTEMESEKKEEKEGEGDMFFSQDASTPN